MMIDSHGRVGTPAFALRASAALVSPPYERASLSRARANASIGK
jgi:hypothetical protein